MGTEEYRRTVGDYVTLVRGTTYKGTLVGEPGPALLGLGSIVPGGGFREGDYKTYGGDCPASLMLFPGDLYVALKGATKDGKMIGSVARVPRTVSSGRLTQDTVKLEFQNPNPKEVAYLYWILRTPQYRTYCANRATGSAVVALSRHDFLTHPVPPLTPTRKQLVDLFEVLDDKIELNREMNKTLEAMARAIFKSWFVDFDPVRAKMEGRQPAGIDAATAELFPDEFEESALGMIPKGWTVGTIKDFGEIICGKTPPTNEADNYGNEIPFITIPDMHGKVFITETSKYLSIKGIQTQPKKTLPVYSICVSCIATPGLVVLTTEPSQTNQQINSLVPSNKLTSFYCYFALRELNEEIKARGSGGTAVYNLNKGQFSEIPILIPTLTLITDFQKLIQLLFENLLLNQKQSRTLASIRNTLLPKLLSGEIPVKEAQKIVETVL